MMKLKKMIASVTLIAVVILSSSANALSIYNNNTRSIRVEVMDCTSKVLYSFPTEWKSEMYNNNPIRYISFLHINRVFPNGHVTIDPQLNKDMPSNVCLHIEGWSSWLGLMTRVRSSCTLTIHDGGFMQGIKAEYSNDC